MATQIGSGTTTLATYIPDLTDTANIQTALKQLYYGTSAGTLSTTTGIYGALYTLFSGNPTLAGNVTITGDLTVSGNTTTLDVSNLLVEDKEIVIGNVTTPTNTTANGGGIRLEAGAGVDKTILWDSTNSNWTTSEHWNLATGKALKINNSSIASGTGVALVLGENATTSLALGNTAGTTTINGTIAVNNPNKTMAYLMGYTSTITTGSPTTLTNTSSYYQQFTGSTAQTVTLPVTSTLDLGWTFHIVNNSTANITVNSSGANLVITVIPGTTAMVTCIGTTLTTAADWESGFTDFSTRTGTGNVVLATSPTLTTPVISSIVNTGTLTVPTSGGTLATTALAGGGTNANLTASDGGIVYSTASALAILSGTATAGKMLRSGLSTAPTWSTATFPDTATSTGTILRANGTNWATSTSTFADTYTANSILYASSANTVSGLAIGSANQVLTVNSGATGLAWAAPGGKVLISQVTTSAGGTTLTFSGIPQTYKTLELVYYPTTAVATGSTTSIQFSGSSATTYYYSLLTSPGMASGTSATMPTSSSASGATSVTVNTLPTTTSISTLIIDNYTSATYAKIGRYNSMVNYSTSNFTHGSFGWTTASAITSITLTFNGTITGQVMTGLLYGIV